MQLSFLIIMSSQIVAASRLDLFKRHHQRSAVSTKQTHLSTVKQKLCTAQICSKCAYTFNYSYSSHTMKYVCLNIMKLDGCCPKKLRIRTFF